MNEWYVYCNDRLVRRFVHRRTGKTRFHGKRVSKDCPLTEAERRIYVIAGTVACIKLIRARGLGLRDAMALLNSTR